MWSVYVLLNYHRKLLTKWFMHCKSTAAGKTHSDKSCDVKFRAHCSRLSSANQLEIVGETQDRDWYSLMARASLTSSVPLPTIIKPMGVKYWLNQVHTRVNWQEVWHMCYNEEEVSIIICHGMDYVILLLLANLRARSYIERAVATISL